MIYSMEDGMQDYCLYERSDKASTAAWIEGTGNLISGYWRNIIATLRYQMILADGQRHFSFRCLASLVLIEFEH